MKKDIFDQSREERRKFSSGQTGKGTGKDFFSQPREGTGIMFPSTHNIPPHNVDNSVKILHSMLSSGNFVLITIKPSLEIVQQLTEELRAFKTQILFRFGIETTNPEILTMWEPYSPPLQSRYDSLIWAVRYGFRTSVSAEPLLGGIQQALTLCRSVEGLVTDDIWIGYMRLAKRRVLTPTPEITAHLKELAFLQNDEMSLLFGRLANHSDKIKLKDSIVKSIERERGGGKKRGTL